MSFSGEIRPDTGQNGEKAVRDGEASSEQLLSSVQRELAELAIEIPDEFKNRVERIKGLTRQASERLSCERGGESRVLSRSEQINPEPSPLLPFWVDMEAGELRAGWSDETIPLDEGSDEQAATRADLLETFVALQAQGGVTGRDIWRHTYGGRYAYDETYLEDFREWVGRITREGDPVIRYDTENDTFFTSDFDVAVGYECRTDSGNTESRFVFPGGEMCHKNPGKVAWMLAERSVKGRAITGAYIREVLFPEDDHRRMKDVSVSMNAIRKCLPEGYSLRDEYGLVEAVAGRRSQRKHFWLERKQDAPS